jgi:DNA-binding transcriptional MocR family regulator
MEELDEKVFDVVLKVIKDSKKIREDYKSKNLQPRFEEKEKIRTQRETLQRKIRTKKSELSKVEEQEIQIEFDVRIGKLTEKQGGSLSQKFKDHIKNINEEINELTSKLDVISNSQGWIDWLDKMSKDLEKVKEYPLEKKREFLLDVLKEIQVQYNPTTQSHKLDIRFLLPLVGDGYRLPLREIPVLE